MNIKNIIVKKDIVESEFINGYTLTFGDMLQIIKKFICGYKINISVFDTDNRKEHIIYITYNKD